MSNPTFGLPRMTRQQPALRPVRFVGDESLDWQSKGSKGAPTWNFAEPIDRRKISVGADIAIMRYHPLHHESLDCFGDTISLGSVILQGKVLGIRRVKMGVVTFSVTDETTGGITSVSIPASYTTISEGGGWHTKAQPLRQQWGLVLRYPMHIRAHDLQAPMVQKKKRITGNPAISGPNIT